MLLIEQWVKMALQDDSKTLSIKAGTIWPASLQVKTPQTTYPLKVNDCASAQAISEESIDDTQPYLYILATLAITNLLSSKKKTGIFMDIDTIDCQESFYAYAQFEGNALVVNIMSGYQTPYAGKISPPFMCRNDCVLYCIKTMANYRNGINGSLPFATRFYSYTDDFIIATSCQDGFIACDIDSSYKPVSINDANMPYYALLLKKVGFTNNNSSPLIWNLS